MITGFSHVQLIVSNVAASADWYQRALGLEEFSRGSFAGGEYAALRSRTGRFVIGLQSARADQPASPPSGSVEHLSFAVADRDALARLRDELIDSGIDAGEMFEEAASWNVRLSDPDGLAIELTAAKSRTPTAKLEADA